jgi:hypothetical protein
MLRGDCTKRLNLIDEKYPPKPTFSPKTMIYAV